VRKTALREIIPGHYAFSSGSFNSGIIVTDDGVVVLDALDSEAAGRAERGRDAAEFGHLFGLSLITSPSDWARVIP
jgi:hypothetical protein